MQPEPAGPGRTVRQKDEASVADVRETAFAGERFGQQAAQPPIEHLERARFLRQRAEVDAGRNRRESVGGGVVSSMGGAHGKTNSARVFMNIIILGKAGATSRNIDLSTRRGRAVCIGLAAMGVVLFMACGFAVGRVSVDVEGQALGEVRQMRQIIASQREALDDVARDSGRDLDALAVQLGQLQAQATRLNALGERLTQVGKLDDGEFDFAAAPALGGPEETPLLATAASPINTGIESLRVEFERQEAQLGMIENMLLDRKIDNALLPTGWPVGGGYIVSGFGMRTDPITGHRSSHLGIDFDVPYGSDIMAVAEGVVTYSGLRSGYGNVVEIDHGNGYMTRYAHNSKNVVEAGARVHIGDVVAKVGSTGRSTGPHCHFEVWLNGRPVNPSVYVRSSRASRV